MITRRFFLRGAVSGALLGRTLFPAPAAASLPPETLYNGITLGSPWPPRRRYPDEYPIRPPYLTDPPAVIPIDLGRQLFVDDFLVESTNLVRTWHHPTYHPANPILRPETSWELSDSVSERTGRPLNPAAMVFSDGVFVDPRDRLFKMWYMAGYGGVTALAVSDDGIQWRRPDFGVVPGTNIVNPDLRDSSTVWLDLETADPRQRYKMSIWYDGTLVLYTSPDGVHWTTIGKTGRVFDRSTFFYNPFRKVWVFSLRATQFEGAVSGRYRKYWESPVFGPTTATWNDTPPVDWVKADSEDWRRPGMPSPPELYNLDCVAYESIMLGLFSTWRGESPNREKINEVTVGFSRDGFHWDRSDRQSFLPVSDREGSWNWANIQSAGGGCLIVGDLLHFYVSGRQGDPGTERPGVCSTGLATLRRDGFASMDWRPDHARVLRVTPTDDHGSLTTRPVRFGGSFLFVNADVAGAELRVEVLDRQGRTIIPFTREACEPVTGSATRMAVRWRNASLADLAGQEVRFRFWLTRGSLYAFWVSQWQSGESGGYVAAGGPGFPGPRDVPAGPGRARSGNP